MTAAADTRKRSREDGDGEMPLSKRINNLHINNNNYLSNPTNGHHPQLIQNHHEHIQHQIQQQFQQQIQLENYNLELSYNPELNYSPELNQDENPYYYDKNKLLYELHAERLRRTQ